MKRPVMIFCLALLGACSNNMKSPPEIVRKVKIETVQQADSLVLRSFPGIIGEAGEISLAFRVAGPIQKVFVKEGDYVNTGQMIAQLDTRDYEVQLEAVQAQYEQVKAEAGRVTGLYNRRSVTPNEYDKAVSGLKMVSAKLRNATDQLSDTRLVAPASGYIQKIYFRDNELTDAGLPVASMICDGHFLVEVDIPASLYVIRDSIVCFTGLQPAVSGKHFPLQLLSVSRKANNNQLFRFQLRLDPDVSPGLAPGMDIQVNIYSKNNAQSRICVPLTALFNEGGNTYVWVYQSQGTVMKRRVMTGKLTGNGCITITGGLNADEQVVVAGAGLLQDNQYVEPVGPVSETNVGGLL